jgi:hypothetical protein
MTVNEEELMKARDENIRERRILLDACTAALHKVSDVTILSGSLAPDLNEIHRRLRALGLRLEVALVEVGEE